MMNWRCNPVSPIWWNGVSHCEPYSYLYILDLDLYITVIFYIHFRVQFVEIRIVWCQQVKRLLGYHTRKLCHIYADAAVRNGSAH